MNDKSLDLLLRAPPAEITFITRILESSIPNKAAKFLIKFFWKNSSRLTLFVDTPILNCKEQKQLNRDLKFRIIEITNDAISIPHSWLYLNLYLNIYLYIHLYLSLYLYIYLSLYLYIYLYLQYTYTYTYTVRMYAYT